MKKKRETPKVDSNPILDLKSIIHQHSLFFDKLVELIPAKFYLPNEKETPWFQGLSKAKKASAKKESKENIKKARRERMDPEKSSATTLDLLKQRVEKEKSNDEGEDDDTEVKPFALEDDERSVTYEELQQRLHHKLKEFQASRIPGDTDRAKKRQERNDKRVAQQKKRKRDTGSGDVVPRTSDQINQVEKDVAEASKELTFSHVKLGNEDEHGRKKRKLSKAKELVRAQKLEQAKKDPEKGEIISKKLSWKAATSRAAGIKVHDDPKLLGKSIHKEKKKREKNAEKWKERVETTGKMKAEKQQKRAKNIADRIHDKKMRRIAKREKKLLRPGFEGRKEGFINEGAA